MNNKYTIIKQESIEELNGTGYILKHDKTGARVVVISNEDDNKVFQIGFRTPPKDDTGVPHILEHSVLCGSREFPMKDPFVELVKGSLNTFLNAMTYPDKTVYPVASQNDKDFFNLVHVYLDAVFYPNIYKKPEILKQEGWHYDLLNEDAPLTYNGVVFNEMKGVFSSPDQQLARIIQKSLLEDTPYGFESGGDPKAIPDLTYEMFLDFHKTYYHPSNSYIYLYGDMDVDEYLTFIDEHYLKDFDKKQIDSSWEKQEPFTEVKRVEEYYPVGENDSEEEKTYLSYNAVIGDSLDAKLYLGFEILNRVLFDAPGAPVKKALMDAQIGKDIQSSYDNGIMQPVFSVIAQEARDWLVFDKASGELIGRAGLEHREFPDAVELELGYLIDPDRQGQGLATEVCQAILAFAREELDFPRVNALTDQKNVASVALLQKLGFYYLEDTDVSGSRTQRYIYEFS